MQFYKLDGINTDENWEAYEDSRRLMREKIRKLSIRTEAFNRGLHGQAFFFVSEATDETVTIGIMVDKLDHLSEKAEEYLALTEIKLKDIFLEEITLSNIRSLLSNARHNDYIEDDDVVLEQFKLENLSSRFRNGIEFTENVLEKSSKKSVFDRAGKYFVKDTLIPELERIYAGSKNKKAVGHPVHYMIQSDDKATRVGVSEILLEALYSNERIKSKRYCCIDVKPGNSPSISLYDNLYRSCGGGAIVVRFTACDDIENDRASGSMELIEDICEVMKKYRNQVLTIFCLNRACNGSKSQFYENLGNNAFIEITEEFVSGEKITEYLKELAKSYGVKTDKGLMSKIDIEESYLPSSLRKFFDEWYNDKLKSDIYPQYKETVTLDQKVIKQPARGSAYDELMEMIGLDEAKKVILQAINYHKAQKLFADKGMKVENVSKHMIFTGNPGTAKTTVARLFARIMKENHLISKGKLIEVGRGDLIGKYVGWTAPMVQRKFKEASGSILFIDEAYSLVDDRDGSFGDEAINTIVQEMENHREDVIVIFAGYPDKMEEFLQKNPGLRSRIAYHVKFDDYETEELGKIADLIADQKGLKFTEEARLVLTECFENARKEADFGNGRFVRNIIERAKVAQATRLLSMDFNEIKKDDVITICAEDIEIPKRIVVETRSIGFSA